MSDREAQDSVSSPADHPEPAHTSTPNDAHEGTAPLQRVKTQTRVADHLQSELPKSPAASPERRLSISTPSSPVKERLFRPLPSRTASTDHVSSAYSHRRTHSGPSRPKATLQATAQDLSTLARAFLRLLPWFPPGHPIREWLKKLFAPPTRAVIRVMAKALHSQGWLAGDLAYDLAVLIFRWIINLFFREIRPRGAHHIPRTGGIIFVAAPHANQFLDPLLLMSEARLSANRRVSFLIAEKSMKRAFVGFCARMMQCSASSEAARGLTSPVATTRAADEAKTGSGTLFVDSNGDGHQVKGQGTSWKKDLQPRFQLQLGKEFDNANVEVIEVIDDATVKVKKPFSEKVLDKLKAAGKESFKYKILPYIDQTKVRCAQQLELSPQMYSRVYTKLREGGCIGIFPEGGSHDRTDLLPLKAGVSIMTLGALADNPNLELHIVPVGLSYFHPHRFRSRAVVEFGHPIEIPSELVALFKDGGAKKREAVGKMLDLVFDGLKSVTVRAPDYETLMVVQAARRLYRPPGQQLSLGAVVELNRRLIAGYLRFKEEPRVQRLRDKVLEYNKFLRYIGIRDHQVERIGRPAWKALILLAYRSSILTIWGSLALPGVILNSPMFIAASIISRKKAKEALAASTVKIEGRDVLATWKILVTLGMAPPVYALYTIFTMYLAYRYNMPRLVKVWTPVLTFAALNAAGYSALRFGESGVDVYKSLRPLLLSLIPGNRRYLERLQTMRSELTVELAQTIDQFGPEMYEDFDQGSSDEISAILTYAVRIVPAAAMASPAGTPAAIQRRANSHEPDLLRQPLEYIDNKLFGWSRNRRFSTNRRQASEESGPADDGEFEEGSSDEAGDYEEFIALEPKSGESTPLRRRRSRNKSGASLTSLTKMDPTQ